MVRPLVTLTVVQVVGLNLINMVNEQIQYQYTSKGLLTIKENITMELKYEFAQKLKYVIPPEIKRRKRGSRGGMKVKLRKHGYRVPLPTVKFGKRTFYKG